MVATFFLSIQVTENAVVSVNRGVLHVPDVPRNAESHEEVQEAMSLLVTTRVVVAPDAISDGVAIIEILFGNALAGVGAGAMGLLFGALFVVVARGKALGVVVAFATTSGVGAATFFTGATGTTGFFVVTVTLLLAS